MRRVTTTPELSEAGDRLVAAFGDFITSLVDYLEKPTNPPTSADVTAASPAAAFPADASNKWLTALEAAKHARRNHITVLKALGSGELHGHQNRRGGRWQVKRNAVDAWIEHSDGAKACGCRDITDRRHRSDNSPNRRA
ncbi:helix-turn-helix domain-containing protein [Amycolatopsis pithecellobii]|uniref:helix-turn-helix domain-containing protein n=1 Tax=Amycolatopsis pithecellobii TaxID=664692 RepID=UPI00140E5003|nr:helix-turn-helix domain-containing protein [Amycolatopsis pithecellobii]